jgi:hypothetical protein
VKARTATPAEAIERLSRAGAIMRGAIMRNAPEGPRRNAALVHLGGTLELAFKAVEAATKEPGDGT